MPDLKIITLSKANVLNVIYIKDYNRCVCIGEKGI